MQRRNLLCLATLATGVLTNVASAQDLMIVESTNDQVMLFSGVNGSLINANFIDLTLATPSPSTPIEAVEVGNEIWISDQVADTVFRFSSDGTTFLGTRTTGRDNMRGIAFINSSLYATNSGTGGSGFGDVCKEYAVDNTLLNTFTVGDPFDVIDFGGALLIADIAGENIEKYAYDGTSLGIFHDSDGITGIDFPEQLYAASSGNVLAAGFSDPSGIYEYDSVGTQLNYFDTGTNSGLRGVGELDNGNLIYTNGSGVWTYDTGTGTSTQVHAGVSGRFITRIGGNGGPGTAYCFGGTAGVGCPCGNNNDGTNGEAGCANGVNLGGASISGTGAASVSGDTVVLTANGVQPNQPGLFFRADNAVNGGMGIIFGDGLRCAGANVIRLGTISSDASGVSTSLPGVGAGLAGGDVRRYQYWYRNPTSSPCGSFFNLSSGYEITWGL